MQGSFKEDGRQDDEGADWERRICIVLLLFVEGGIAIRFLHYGVQRLASRHTVGEKNQATNFTIQKESEKED